jgi:hypothetical protein
VTGHDVVREARAVRRSIGVAFQTPSLDGKLRVRENLVHQGHLHGLRGRELAARIDELLDRFRLTDRAADRADTLSGGLARRVDLAKALLHRPRVLLLSPSTWVMARPASAAPPSAWRSPRTSSRSSPGVRMVTAAWVPRAVIVSGASSTTSSGSDRRDPASTSIRSTVRLTRGL